MFYDNYLKNFSKEIFYIFLLAFFLFKDVRSNNDKNWYPKYANENMFEEPFDYVSDSYIPNLVEVDGYDWISSSGTSLYSMKKSYIAFTGTRQNKAKNFSSVFTKESGILVLCESTLATNQSFNMNLNCKMLEERSLVDRKGMFFGSSLRSVKFNEGTALFIYCDPLWFDDTLDHKNPVGKCTLSYIKNNDIIKTQDFKVCDSFLKCLGGFSVDILSDYEDIQIIFGSPFANTTVHLKSAQTNSMALANKYKGQFYNFGYAVSFSGDGKLYISSPVSDEKSPFVTEPNGVKFFPQDEKTQKFGGFGTSIDTVKIGYSNYGVVIGAPYQSKQNLPNVGAAFLACKGYKTDIVMGEGVYDYFGYAVARIGDLDSDGFDEFAVSAPSLNLDKPGKIYIFKIIEFCQIQKKPIQVYHSKIKGFGISITRGFDIDFNGSPDFFVTSLNSKKPSLFKMPAQSKITCVWVNADVTDILSKDDTFIININFHSMDSINFDDYFFQVASDFMNKDDKRFELIDTKIDRSFYKITFKMLIDAIDMDFRTTPFNLDIKGTRSCKKSNENCFLSNAYNIKWDKCERTINVTQHRCGSPKCLTDLELKVKTDKNGKIIYLGNQKNYIRKLDIVINNLGEKPSPRIYLEITSNPDIMITNAACNIASKVILSPTGQNTSIIIKETVDATSRVNITVDILYKRLNETKSNSSINFKIWGINEDEDMSNNEVRVDYIILFKPNLTLSSIKAENTIIDPRLKPPYLETLKKVPVHELGTELKFSYIIENKGPELKNVEFKLKFPYKTEDGRLILYVMNKIRLAMNETFISALPSIFRNDKLTTTCTVQDEVINPLKVIAVESHIHGDVQLPVKGTRLKRSINDDSVITFENSHNDSTVVDSYSHDEKTSSVSSRDRSTILDCNMTSNKLGRVICSEVVCKLKELPMNSVFYFDFKSWVFTKTFFDAKLADIIITTSLESNIGDLPRGVVKVDGDSVVGPYTASHNVLYSKMVVLADKPLPLWPIILAIIVGIILLVIIIIIAYYCGFFKRKRIKEELKKKRETKKLQSQNEDKKTLHAY